MRKANREPRKLTRRLRRLQVQDQWKEVTEYLALGYGKTGSDRKPPSPTRLYKVSDKGEIQKRSGHTFIKKMISGKGLTTELQVIRFLIVVCIVATIVGYIIWH